MASRRDKITKTEDYNRVMFGKNKLKKIDLEKAKEALKYAHEIRQFEIRLYWQRSLFFWGFMVTLFVALGVIVSSDRDDDLILRLFSVGITLLGLVVTYAWRYIEMGSKFWQENFEFHIDFLEDAHTGKFHKTVFGEKEKAYSVSKITRFIIVAFMIFWFCGSITSIYTFIKFDLYCYVKNTSDWCIFACAALIVFLIILIIFLFKNNWKTSDRTLAEPKNAKDSKTNDKNALRYWQRKDPDLDNLY